MEEGPINHWKLTTDKVEKIINNINIKKATGADGIPAKIIKCSKSIIAPQITSILNMSIDQSVTAATY
jgi:hypothetical protein